MLFNRNTVTGRPTTLHRRFDDGALMVTLQLGGGPITLLVFGDLADQIEVVLVARRGRGETGALTLEYDPATGVVIGFSVAG